MQVISTGYSALSLVVNLTWDRVFFFGTIAVGLLAGAFLGSAIGTIPVGL